MSRPHSPGPCSEPYLVPGFFASITASARSSTICSSGYPFNGLPQMGTTSYDTITIDNSSPPSGTNGHLLNTCCGGLYTTYVGGTGHCTLTNSDCQGYDRTSTQANALLVGLSPVAIVSGVPCFVITVYAMLLPTPLTGNPVLYIPIAGGSATVSGTTPVDPVHPDRPTADYSYTATVS